MVRVHVFIRINSLARDLIETARGQRLKLLQGGHWEDYDGEVDNDDPYKDSLHKVHRLYLCHLLYNLRVLRCAQQ